MTAYVALLRAVNVGGTGKLPMPVLARLCAEAGFTDVRTYIASGNAVFRSDLREDAVRRALEASLLPHLGRPTGVLVRTAAEMAETVSASPFADEPGSRVMALFMDGPLPDDPLDGVSGRADEAIAVGPRALFIHYPGGMARTRLRVPGQEHGTARNMNTVAALARMSQALA